jgi:DNA-binding NarL/FixJ family response regulator
VTDLSTVVIADDHPRNRELTRRALDGTGFEVVGEAADAAGAVALALRHRPDVALLDVNMPGGGLRTAAEISVALPDTAVIMHTVSTSEDDLFEALRAGARGYLLRDTDPQRLPLALKGVLAGEAALPRQLVVRLMEEFRLRDRPRRLTALGHGDVSLTPREWDVLELLRQGLTTAEIAERLYISKVTVRTHISGILHKLHVTSREEAIRSVSVGGHSTLPEGGNDHSR